MLTASSASFGSPHRAFPLRAEVRDLGYGEGKGWRRATLCSVKTQIANRSWIYRTTSILRDLARVSFWRLLRSGAGASHLIETLASRAPQLLHPSSRKSAPSIPTRSHFPIWIRYFAYADELTARFRALSMECLCGCHAWAFELPMEEAMRGSCVMFNAEKMALALSALKESTSSNIVTATSIRNRMTQERFQKERGL